MDDMGIIGKRRERDGNWLMMDTVVDKTADDPQGASPEVFHFPGPGGDGTQPADPDDLADGEKLRFAPNRVRGVSEDKRWGDQMNYAWGRVFNWGGGPELGSGMAGGEYNYGNGYTENLILHQGFTSTSLGYRDSIHSKDELNTDELDDNGWSPSPTEGMSGFLGVVAKHMHIPNDWLKKNIDLSDWVEGKLQQAARYILDNKLSGNLDHYLSRIFPEHVRDDIIKQQSEAAKLFPDTTTVERTYGGTYSYHLGFAVDIHQGNSVSKVYGDQEEMVDGDSESVVKGDEYTTVVGNSNNFTLGNTSGILIGGQEEITLGEEFEFHGTLKQEIALGNVSEIFLGFKQDLVFSLDLELGYAPAIKWRQSPTIEKLSSAKIVADEARIDKVEAAIKEGQVKLDGVKFIIAQMAMKIEG